MDDLEVGRYALRTFRHDQGAYGWERPFDSIAIGHGAGHWKDGTCTAQCLKSPVLEWVTHHDAPYHSCRCGIYGCLSLEHLVFQYPVEARNIVTVIAAEGTTYLGNKGLRTQFARVVAYWCPHHADEAAGQFKDAVHFQDLFGMVQYFGLDLRMPELPCSRINYYEYGEYFAGNGWPPEFVTLFTEVEYREGPLSGC